MKKTKRPKIIVKLTKRDGEIIEMVIKDEIKKAGESGHIIFPKELVGKYVEIKLKVLK